MDRRRFLQLAATGAAGLTLAACTDESGLSISEAPRPPARAKRRPRPAASTAPAPTSPLATELTTLASGVVVPTAPWLIAENNRPGTLDWIVWNSGPDHALEGFASQVSAVPGDDVALFVNTTASAVQVQAYRMGYYQGLGGRLVYQSDFVAAGPQAAPVVSPVGTVSCPWSPTMTLGIDYSWPPGCYLLKLVGNTGVEQHVPLTIRDDGSTAAFVIQNSVTTWQAYNLYGGYSLYYGPNGRGQQDFANRARAVSFDRPYPQTWAQGAADFVGNEFPLLFDLERLGLDLTYWTDVDLHAQPGLLTNHACLFSLGHDEYWSSPMRTGAATASAAGVNLAFLGANACYRQIRFQPTSVGVNRLEVCYKSAQEDPMAEEDPSLTTVNWNEAPVNDPESLLIGSTYQAVGANANMIVTDGSSWFFSGCDLSEGSVLPALIEGEFDRYVPALPGPRALDVLAHSPVPGQGNWSDLTYYTAPGGGGVLASGSACFVGRMANAPAISALVLPPGLPGEREILLRAMENLYGLFGNGPASATMPSSGNWSAVYTGTALQSASAQPTVSA